MPQTLTYELIISCSQQDPFSVEVLKGALIGMGLEFEDIIEVQRFGKTHISLFFTRKTRFESFKKRVRALKIKGLKYSSKVLEKHDWETKWKNDFRPYKLTSSFYIVPAWVDNVKIPRGMQPIYLDTGIAFGTGLHPTTRYMSEFIERLNGKFDTLLDIGTGTGLLAIVAVKCGAESGLCVDISPDAVKTAKQNLKVNDIRSCVVRKDDIRIFTSDQNFDLVTANLITDDLLDNRSAIIKCVKKNGYLAVSGVSVVNLNRFKMGFSSPKLKCLKITKGEGWCALLYKRVK